MNDVQTIHATPAGPAVRPTDLRDLLEAQDRDFVEAAYRLLLGRDADPGGLQFYLSRLRGGARKLQILQEMSTSDEALASRIELKGLRSALRWQRLKSMPLLGDLLRFCFESEGDSPAEVRSRILEHQPYVLNDALTKINKRQDHIESQLPLLQRTQADLNHRLLAIERQQLPALQQTLADLNHRWLTFETQQLSTLQRTLSDLTHRRRSFETRQLPILVQTLSDLNQRWLTFEAQQLPTLVQTLSELNHRRRSFETRQLPILVQTLSDLIHRQLTFEAQQLPPLLQTLSELKHRQLTFETQQLPTLLQTLSDVNHRQLSSDNARDNLVKSVPVALRKLTRDIIEVRAHQDSMSAVSDQNFIETREQISGAKDLIDQRVELLRHQLESTLDSLRQRIIEVHEKFENTSAICDQLTNTSIATEQRFGETREQIETATRLMDRSVIEIRDQIRTASHDVGYLFGRVEFIRRELMFEMRYGASAPPDGLDQLHVESKILSPEKLDAARKIGIRLNLGCGHVALEGYLNVDRRALPGVDIVSEVDDLPFTAGQVAEIASAHLIEHFPQEQLRRTLLKYWRDLLRPGGHFRVVAPDAEGMMQAYYKGEYPFERLREVTFGGQDYNGDFHYNMLNTKSLTELLLAAGFIDVKVIAENRENGGCKEFEIAARRPEAE